MAVILCAREQVVWWRENGFTASQAMDAIATGIKRGNDPVTWAEVETVASREHDRAITAMIDRRRRASAIGTDYTLREPKAARSRYPHGFRYVDFTADDLRWQDGTH